MAGIASYDTGYASSIPIRSCYNRAMKKINKLPAIISGVAWFVVLLLTLAFPVSSVTAAQLDNNLRYFFVQPFGFMVASTLLPTLILWAISRAVRKREVLLKSLAVGIFVSGLLFFILYSYFSAHFLSGLGGY